MAVGGGSVTSNLAPGGPVSIELISSKPWGVNNTEILKQRDEDTVALYFTNDVTEQLNNDGTTSNPNDYEEVSEVDVPVNNKVWYMENLFLDIKLQGKS